MATRNSKVCRIMASEANFRVFGVFILPTLGVSGNYCRISVGTFVLLPLMLRLLDTNAITTGSNSGVLQTKYDIGGKVAVREASASVGMLWLPETRKCVE